MLVNLASMSNFLLMIPIILYPLSIIHSDVWQSHVSSFYGYHYYVLFLDGYTKYYWVYPLKNKSKVFSEFVQFKKEVEN